MVGPPPNTITETCPIQYIEWVESAMAITNDFVFKNLGTAAKRQKYYYDQGLKSRQYKKGDWVWRTSESETSTKRHGSVQHQIRPNQAPIIRSRRESPVKLEQIWSP